MDKQIREDKVLEFKALCMTKKVFDQLITYKPGDSLPEFIGWVNDTHKHFIAEVNGGLVKIDYGALWEHYFARRPTLPDIDMAKYEKSRLWVENQIAQLAVKLPQIFIR